MVVAVRLRFREGFRPCEVVWVCWGGGGGGDWEDLGVTRKMKKKMRLKHISYFILQFSSPISRFSGFAVEDFGQFLFRSALCENRTFVFAFQLGHILHHVFVVVVVLCVSFGFQ